MVTQANHRGLRDWLVQRVTALIIGIYAIFMLAYLLCKQPLDYMQWHALFHQTGIKLASFIVLLSIMWHAWIGLWTVFTDYVKNTIVRLVLEVLVILLLLSYLAWGFEILRTT